MVLPSRRGGVPVLRRPWGSCSSLRRAARETDGGVAHATAGVVGQADVDQAVEEGAGGEDHGRGFETDTQLGDGADDAVPFDDQVVASLGEDGQVGLVFQAGANGLLVQHPVGLGPGGPHGGALGGVEDAELDAALVGGCRHGAAQGVHFLDQVPLADAANGGIAAHGPQGFQVVGEQQGVRPHAGGRQGSLGAGVAAANDDDIKSGRK